MNWEIIGLTAGVCTTFCFLPQVIKAWKTKKLEDFAWLYLGILCTGVVLWFIYGLGINSISVILANVVTLLFVLTIIGMKWYYNGQNK